MALEKKIVSVDVHGLDGGKDPKLASKALRIENGVWRRTGAIQKRYGVWKRTSSEAANGYIVERGGLPMLVGDNIRKWSASAFSTVDAAYPYDIELEPAEDENLDVKFAECAANTSFKLVALTRRDGYVEFRSIARSSGAVIGRITAQDGTLAHAHYHVANDRLYYFYVDHSAPHTLMWGYVDTAGAFTTAAAFPDAETDIRSDFAVCDVGTNTIMVVLSGLYTARNQPQILMHNVATGVTTHNHGGLDCISVGCFPLSATTGIALYWDLVTGIVSAEGWGITASVTVTLTALRTLDMGAAHALTGIGGVAINTTLAKVCLSYDNTGATTASGETCLAVYLEDTAGTGSIWGLHTVALGMRICGYPFNVSSGRFVLPLMGPVANAVSGSWDTGACQPAANCYLALVHDELDTARPYGSVTPTGACVVPGVAKWFLGVAPVYPGNTKEFYVSPRGYVDPSETSAWLFAGVYLRDRFASGAATAWEYGAKIVRIRRSLTSLQCISTRGALLTFCSMPQTFDGTTNVEQSFLHYPFGVLGAASGTGSGLAAGVYGYKAIYRWTDATGKVFRSQESPTCSVTTTAAQEVALRLAAVQLSVKNNVRCEIYRTKVNGSIFYMLTSVAGYGGDITYTDTLADATLVKGALLYTTGDVIGNDQPPPMRIVCEHHSRIFGVPRDNEDSRVYYSKNPGEFEPYEFSDYLVINVPRVGGAITALASWKDRLFIFKAGAIYVVTGTELDNALSGYGPAAPVLISDCHGTAVGRSVVVTPSGVMFYSAVGIMGISTSGGIEAAGDPVKHITDVSPVICAVVNPAEEIAIFFTAASACVFNYRRALWATFSNHAVASPANAVAIGSVYWYASAGSIYMEAGGNPGYWRDYDADTTLYADVSLAIETGWISTGGVGGISRVYRALLLGQKLSNCVLTLRTAYDLDPLWVDTQPLDVSPLASTTFAEHYGAMTTASFADTAALLDAGLSRTRNSAVRFRLYDETVLAGSLHEGYSLTGIQLLVGEKIGLVKPGAARRIGV